MKKIFAIFITICGFLSNAGAQTAISNEKISHDGKNVTVTFDLDTDNADIPSRRKEVIMPYLHNGKDTLFLDAMEIYGKGRYKRERQVNAIDGDRKWELSDNQTLKKTGTYTYVSQAPLKRWMTVAKLGLRRQLVGCACEKEMPEDSNIAQAELFKVPQVQRRLPEYILEDAIRQWDFGQDELEIVFKVSKAEIDSTVFNNEITFGNILAAVDKIFSNPHFRVDKIEIAGYASPEGSRRFNNWLGENRAKALMDYIISHRPQYALTPDHFNIHNGEENWAGLRRHLLESQIEERDSVTAIRDSPLPDEEKKSAIKALNGGKVWKHMLEQVYPHLRCARYLAIFYDSTDDQAVEHINEANAMIREGQYEQAYEVLLKVGDDMRAYNSIGVALMMQKKFEEALPWLEKALQGNCPSAEKNIVAIKTELDREARQRKEIEEYLNKYN